jgi:Multicopper oxidase
MLQSSTTTLSEIGNAGNPQYGYFGFNYQNVHFHGVGIPSSTEQLTAPLDGGERRIFSYKIPDDHPGGLYWYHNHVHALGTYGYLSGLFGMMIIEGHPTDILSVPEIKNAKEILMIMSESLVNENNQPVPIFPIVSKYRVIYIQAMEVHSLIVSYLYYALCARCISALSIATIQTCTKSGIQLEIGCEWHTS